MAAEQAARQSANEPAQEPVTAPVQGSGEIATEGSQAAARVRLTPSPLLCMVLEVLGSTEMGFKC